MAVNDAIVGKQYPPLDPYLVGREKIREFARAVMSETAVNTSVQLAQDAGFPDLVAPPTFAVIVQERALGLLLDDPDSGIDYSRIVHGNQRFDYSRPIVAGDELYPVMTVTTVQSLGVHSMVTSETVVNDKAGHHVVTATSTLVVRGEDS